MIQPNLTSGSTFRLRRLRRLGNRAAAPSLLLMLLAACSSSDDSGANPTGGAGTGGAGAGGAAGTAGSGGDPGALCPDEETVFETGDVTGHAEPYGAKAAGEARAGRLTAESMIVQPAHGRQQIRVGDYVLANDKIAVVIEDIGLSDGYSRFGGEILAIDKVGEDGRPLGVSNYLETLVALSNEVVKPTSVTVMNDGSDGNAAVIRATGKLSPVAILDGALAPLFSASFGLEAALDYVLEPGSSTIQIRYGIINPRDESIEITPGQEMHGFFQTSHNQLASLSGGFDKPTGVVDWLAFVSGEWNFAYRLASGAPMTRLMDTSGFYYYYGEGFTIDDCSTTWRDHIDIIAGGPHFDGLIAAVNAADGKPAPQSVIGTLRDADGEPVAGAYLHAETEDGVYLSRTRTDENGQYAIMAAPDEGDGFQIISGAQTLPSKVTHAASGQTVVDIALPAHGTIRVAATEFGTDAQLPVRIQVVPTDGIASWAGKYGIPNEKRDRLHQEFAMDGMADLRVPPGEHRVIVSRGYEWELHDETVSVGSGEVTEVTAVLEHSVDSTGVMCADFHIHTHHSADSSDPISLKVKSAIADGLDIPVSSEHDWVIDFQPVIEDLGLEQWAFGMPSLELTTFSWGHFGVVPLIPRPDQVNNGAIDWPNRTPADVFAEVQDLPEDPVLVINHPSGSGMGAYFGVAGLNNETGVAWDQDMWSDNFDAIEVFNNSSFDSNRDGSVADWFSLLNAGYTYWAVGSSDSHSLRSTPVGYPRTCMTFGHDDLSRLTPEIVGQVLGDGTSTISGGLFMSVSGPEGAGPGETLVGESSVEFLIEIRAPSWVTGDTLEVIVDGVTQEEITLLPFGSGTGNTWANRVTVDFDANKNRSWVVFHAKGADRLLPLHDKAVFAASNPVFYEP